MHMHIIDPLRRFYWSVRAGVLVAAVTSCLAVPAAAQVDVIVGSAAALHGGSTRVVVSGDLDNQGTFDPEQSTVVFDGSGAQSVRGVSTFSGLGVDKAEGTLSLGGAVTVRDRLELTGGTFDNSGAESVALGDGATIVRRAGTLAAPPAFGATVNLVYEGDEPVATGNEVPEAGSGVAVQNLTVKNTAGVTLTTPVVVNGSLSLEAGTLDNTQAPVTVSASGSVEPGAGSVSAAPVYEGPVVLVYDGEAAHTTGMELPDTTNVLVIDNPAGVALGKDVHVLDTLAVRSGTLVLGGHTVTLEAPDALLVERAGAAVVGESGRLRATRVLDAPQDVDVAGLGFRITSDANLGATTVERTHAVPFEEKDGVARVYTVTPTNNAGLNATIAFTYAQTELGGLSEPDLGLFRSSDGGSWVEVGGDVDTTANTITLDGLNSLAYFAAGISGKSVGAEDAAGLPRVFALHGNYPNPFNPSTAIHYELPRTANVRLEVFDLLGRRLTTLVDERQAAGTYEAIFNAGDLGSGVYFYRMQAGDFTAAGSMLLVK